MTKTGAKRNHSLVLVADDDPTIRILARESLGQAGFGVEEAETGAQALSAFEQLQPDIVLLDVLMPEMDGFTVCTSIRGLPGGDSIPVVMMTGMDDIGSINRAYDVGATDFIAKPINWVILGHRVRYMLRASQTLDDLRRSEAKNRALLNAMPDLMLQVSRDGILLDFKAAKDFDLLMFRREFLNRKAHEVLPKEVARQTMHYLQRTLRTGAIQIFEFQLLHNGELGCYEARIAESGENEALALIRDITERKRLEEALKQSLARLQTALDETIKALSTMAEIRDPYTAGHQQRVTRLACGIAREMGLSDDQIRGTRVAGILHDIGKISVPAEILSKPGQIMKTEFALAKTHPQTGHDIIRTIKLPWPVAQIVVQHHERMDGSGYPSGLSGENILLEARILAVADVVEAMASHRPYRPALGIDKALEEISKNRGIRYDAEVVDACLRLFTDKGFKL